MTMQNVAVSIPPLDTPSTSPQIDGTDRQPSLPVGPTGVVHRRPEPRTEEELRDNREFLRVAGQVDFGPGKHILTLVWMAVAYYASLGPERICWAKVEKVAKKAKGLSTRTVQRKLNELAGLGRISTGKRSGGYKSTYWDVHLQIPSAGKLNPPNHDSVSPQPRQPVMENHDSVSPDVRDRREGTEEKNLRTVGKPTTFPSKRADTGQTKQQRLVAAVCWKLGFSVTAAGLEEFAGREHTEKQALIKRLLLVEARHDRRTKSSGTGTSELPTAGTFNNRHGPIVPSSGKYKAGTNVPPAAKKPKKTKGKAKTSRTNVPPVTEATPLTPEVRSELEALAVGRDGYRKRAGKWVKSWM